MLTASVTDGAANIAALVQDLNLQVQYLPTDSLVAFGRKTRTHTKAQIARLLQTYLAKIGISARDGRILNVGSHGNAYEWREIAYTRSSGLHR